MAGHTVVSIHPYFTVPEGRMDEVRAIGAQCVERTQQEPGCLYYGFSFDGNAMYCREAYDDANAALAHLQNVGPLIEQLLGIVTLDRLEVHGPVAELAKLREPMAPFGPTWWAMPDDHRR